MLEKLFTIFFQVKLITELLYSVLQGSQFVVKSWRSLLEYLRYKWVRDDGHDWHFLFWWCRISLLPARHTLQLMIILMVMIIRFCETCHAKVVLRWQDCLNDLLIYRRDISSSNRERVFILLVLCVQMCVLYLQISRHLSFDLFVMSRVLNNWLLQLVLQHLNVLLCRIAVLFFRLRYNASMVFTKNPFVVPTFILLFEHELDYVIL